MVDVIEKCAPLREQLDRLNSHLPTFEADAERTAEELDHQRMSHLAGQGSLTSRTRAQMESDAAREALDDLRRRIGETEAAIARAAEVEAREAAEDRLCELARETAERIDEVRRQRAKLAKKIAALVGPLADAADGANAATREFSSLFQQLVPRLGDLRHKHPNETQETQRALDGLMAALDARGADLSHVRRLLPTHHPLHASRGGPADPIPFGHVVDAALKQEWYARGRQAQREQRSSTEDHDE